MRAMRSVDLSFGMVTIPGQIFAIQVERQGTGLSNFCPDCKGRIGMRKYCQSCGKRFVSSKDPFRAEKDMDWGDPVKGEEVGDKVVIVTGEELDAIKPQSSQQVAIQYFVPIKNLSRSLHLYVEKVYLWRPAPIKRGRKVLDNSHYRQAASLTRQAMSKTGVVGVAKLCISAGREHIVLVKPEGDVLLLLQMRYETEVRLGDIQEAEVDEEGINVPKELIAQGETVIKSMTRKALGPELTEDAYTANLDKLIESKMKGKKLEIAAPARAEPTFDLQAALTASVASVAPIKVPAK